MRKARIICRWVVGPAVAAALVLGSTSVPAQAKDSGWNGTSSPIKILKDSGWNGTSNPIKILKDSGWNGTVVVPTTTVRMMKDSGWNGT